MPTRYDTTSWWRRSPFGDSLWTRLTDYGDMVQFRHSDEFDIQYFGKFDTNSDSDADFECDDSDALDLFFEELAAAR